MKCRLSVNRGVDGVSIKGHSRVAIKDIDQLLTVDAFGTINCASYNLFHYNVTDLKRRGLKRQWIHSHSKDPLFLMKYTSR